MQGRICAGSEQTFVSGYYCQAPTTQGGFLFANLYADGLLEVDGRLLRQNAPSELALIADGGADALKAR